MDAETHVKSPAGGAGRFWLLDPLRGVAASAVVLDHVAEIKIGYFAVLVFFIISGYCIMASTEASFAKRMSVAEYMKRRVRRIYPPYLASLVFYLLTRILKWKMSGDATIFQRPLLHWIQTVTLTQWVSLLPGASGYPYDNGALLVAAHWSLNYEEQFYLFMGLVMVASARLGTSLRSFVLPFTVVTTVGMAFFPQLCIGLFVDYWPLFGLGAIVYLAVDGGGSARFRRALSLVPVAVLAVSAAVLFFRGRGIAGHRSIWEDLLTGALVALVLVVARPHDARLATLAPLRLLGKIGTVSYSLYLIHQFNITLMAQIAGRIVAPSRWAFGNIVLQIALHIALAAGFWWAFERPFLNTRPSASRPPAPEPVPSASA